MTVAQSYSDYILDLRPALFGILAYVRNTWGAKKQSKIILLNLISSRLIKESPRYYGTTNHSNVDSPLKMYCDNGCDVTIANSCKGILSMFQCTLTKNLKYTSVLLSRNSPDQMPIGQWLQQLPAV